MSHSDPEFHRTRQSHSASESNCCCQSERANASYAESEESTCCQSGRYDSEPEDGCCCQSERANASYAESEESTCCQSGRYDSEPEGGCCCQSERANASYEESEGHTCCQSGRRHSKPEEGNCRCRSQRRARSGTSRIEGIENPRTLDAVAYHPKKGRVILAMYELRPWVHGHKQLYQLQEKLNAYASYVLDGEMEEDFPEFQSKQVHIQLRTMEDPSDRAMEFIHQARKQLELQDITLEVIRISSVEDEAQLIED